ncbi:retrovirus-related pol polyprotein from transposon TNT 1-94 [Tanacetum coccineum]
MSEKGMKILASKGRIPDLQKAIVGFCEPCVLGKQKKVSFVKYGNTRKLQRLELVHTDVYDPTFVASIGGSRYYVTFINDNTRKCLNSDNGREYSSREFIEYCAENGIRMLKTIPETPQQNGVAERMNRTLNERAKSMRLHAELPKMFWEDSVTTEAYLINRGPSMPLGFRISEDKWQGKEVSLAHLRVFGCDSYVKVKDVAKDKLDAKSMKCTFIGYGSYEMRYRFWDSKSHKKDQVVLEDSPENLANKSIVIEHGLSLAITQSLSGNSDTSEGSKIVGASRMVEDQMKKTMKTEHPLRREAPRLHSYKDLSESPGLRLVLSIVAVENLHLEQLDIKTAFLHGDLDEDIYMTQPEGPAKQILGMSIIKDKTKGTLRLSQEKYTGKVLEKFNMKDAEAKCQPLGDHFKLSKKQAPKTEAFRRRMAKVPYASAVGSVMYAMVCTSPDIAHAVGVVSRFMSNLGREHWEAVKWLLRYLKGTSKAKICFSRKEVVLEGFSDSDYGGCLDSGKSTTGYIFTVGGITVSWMSRIQKRVAMSTTKAEYMAIAEAGKEVLSSAKNPDVIFDEDSWSREPCRYVHQGGDNIDVEALRNINWPPR